MNQLDPDLAKCSEIIAMGDALNRFCRRLREQGIRYTVLPGTGQSRKVTVGNRTINVFSDGSCTRSLLRPNGRFDHGASDAQGNRMHAGYLATASELRKIGNKKSADFFVMAATEERIHHECD